MHFIKNKFDRIEAIFLFIFIGIYCNMAIFGLGVFWDKFSKVDIFISFSLFPFFLLINRYFLIKKLIINKKWISYIIIILGILLILEYSKQYFIDNILLKTKVVSISSFVPSIAGIFVSWILFLSKDWFQKNEEIEAINAEKLQYELNYLKGQINPHFLFNAMNSIYANALKEDALETAESIADLSYLLRYNLHDSFQNTISINKEIEYIRKYVQIQQARLTSNTTILLTLPQEPIAPIYIAPLLFIPLVENAFKYGVSSKEISPIEISIKIEQNELILETKNTVFHQNKAVSTGGIGLNNLSRRLEILYPNQYKLKTEKTGNQYFATLSIQIKQ